MQVPQGRVRRERVKLLSGQDEFMRRYSRTPSGRHTARVRVSAWAAVGGTVEGGAGWPGAVCDTGAKHLLLEEGKGLEPNKSVGRNLQGVNRRKKHRWFPGSRN